LRIQALLKRHVSSLEKAGNSPRKAVFFQEDTKETVAEEERHVEGRNMADPKNVTQRDAYIIAQALYEFIRLEQSKPRNLRRRSDE
jgi:hypothetical protein